MRNPILTSLKRHWAGKAEFIWLILINLVAVRLVVQFFGSKIQNAPIAAWAIFFLFIAVITLWQVVGTFRAAKSGLDHPDGIFIVIAQFVAVTGVLITTTWQLTDQYHRLFDPVPDPYVDPSIITLPRSADGTQIVFEGPITLKQYNAFRDLQDYTDLKQVSLNSRGGNIFAARGLYRLIQERKLNTFVSDKCFSACTVVFMGGIQRAALPNAVFGFHSYAYAHNHTGQIVDVQAEQTKDVALFENQGVPIGFINKIFATPSNELWYPTQQELRVANVLN